MDRCTAAYQRVQEGVSGYVYERMCVNVFTRACIRKRVCIKGCARMCQKRCQSGIPKHIAGDISASPHPPNLSP